MSAAHLVEVNDRNFAKEVLSSEQPVLVKFWASWCGSCRSVTPVVEGVAAQYSDRIRVGKVDVDENGRMAAEYHVYAVPTLIIFRKGKVVDRVVGSLPRAKLEAFLARALR